MQDWKLCKNLQKQLKFSLLIVMTPLRPEMFPVSDMTKTIVLLELTVVWADHVRRPRKAEDKVQIVGQRLLRAGLEGKEYVCPLILQRFGGAIAPKCLEYTGYPRNGVREEPSRT